MKNSFQLNVVNEIKTRYDNGEVYFEMLLIIMNRIYLYYCIIE